MSKKAYLISLKKHNDKYLTIENFNKYFDKNKLWEKGTIYRSIDFAYNEGNKELWDKHMIISNTFSFTQYKYLTNKASLYKTIKELEPENYNKFMQYHTDIDINNLNQYESLFQDNKIFILRPTWGFARHGIQIFDTFDKFKKFMIESGIDEYNKAVKRKQESFNKPIYVLSEYLQNQLTIKNKLFNFRVFFLVSLMNNIYRTYLIKPIVIHTATKDYELNKDNIDMTKLISASDSEFDYTLDDLEKEIGKEKCVYIKNQIKHNLSYLFKIIKKTKCFESYENVENTYELFGLDFIADKDCNIKLIEFNDRVGITNYSDKFYDVLTAAILHSTINKLYPKEYHINIEKKIKKNAIRIRSQKKYL
jgi:hypothetical protein